MTDIDSAKEGCYVGRCKCGAIVAATVDAPDRKKDVAKDVAEFINDGLTVERMSVEQVRVGDWNCRCPKDTQLTLEGYEPEQDEDSLGGVLPGHEPGCDCLACKVERVNEDDDRRTHEERVKP